jgi:hydrogenase expression/formation protein HypC
VTTPGPRPSASGPAAPGPSASGPAAPGPSASGPAVPARGAAAAAAAAAVPECHGDICITCSDTAVEVTIVRLLADGLAVVNTGQGEEEVSVALVQAQVGDTILVHAKEAIAVVGR